jgi:hypothetical protein
MSAISPLVSLSFSAAALAIALQRDRATVP